MEKNIKNELLLSKLWMSHYPEPDKRIRDKNKVILKLSNYATKNKLEHATGVNMSDLAAKKILLLWKLNLIN